MTYDLCTLYYRACYQLATFLNDCLVYQENIHHLLLLFFLEDSCFDLETTFSIVKSGPKLITSPLSVIKEDNDNLMESL